MNPREVKIAALCFPQFSKLSENWKWMSRDLEVDVHFKIWKEEVDNWDFFFFPFILFYLCHLQ